MHERRYDGKKILAGEEFKRVTQSVQRWLPIGRYAMIGGLAVSHYSNPPATIDIDFLFEASKRELLELKVSFSADGFKTRILVFPHRQNGLPRFGIQVSSGPGEIVDIIGTGEDEFLKSIIHNSIMSEVQPGFKIPVVTAEDLFIMKSLVGREKDLDDIASLQDSVKKLDFDYIYKKLEELE